MEAYFRELSLKCVSLGFEPRSLVHAVLVGVEAMQNNDGSLSNEERFFRPRRGDRPGIRDHKPVFREFYLNEFHRVKDEAVQPTPLAAQCIAALSEKGYQLVLATNAIFPGKGFLPGWRGRACSQKTLL